MLAYLAEAVCGVGFIVGFAATMACWFMAVVGRFVAVAHRKPTVSLRRAFWWHKEIMWGRNVYVEDLFTDAGVWWAKASLRAIPGFVVAFAATLVMGLVCQRIR